MPTKVLPQDLSLHSTGALGDLGGQALGVKVDGTTVTINGLDQLQVALTLGIGAGFDGAGNVLTSTNGMTSRRVPAACTIKSYTIWAADHNSGSITLTLKKSNLAGFPGSLADITGGANIVLSSAVSHEDTTLSGWSTSLAAGDMLEFAITGAPVSVTKIVVQLKVQ